MIEALSKFLWPIIIMRLGETLSESPEAIPICLKSLRHLKCLVYLSFPYENKERDKLKMLNVNSAKNTPVKNKNLHNVHSAEFDNESFA